MLPVDVDTAAYEAASALFGQNLTASITKVAQTLGTALGSTGGMAGTDPAGTSWSAQYDPAAQDTYAVLRDLADAATTIAALLEQTGFNHGMAEAASDPTRLVPTPPDTTSYTVGPQACSLDMPDVVPSAHGGSSSPPHGWGMLQHWIGYAWPNGHQDKLNAAATAWHDAADALPLLTGLIYEAESAISAQQSAEVADAVTVCDSMVTHLHDVASQCRIIGDACGQLAGHIDQAHHAIEHECISFVEWTAAIQVGGGFLGAITFGIGEGVAQGVEAARAATTGTRIGEIIAALIEAARTVAAAVTPVLSRIGEVATDLKLILGAQALRVAVEFAPTLPALSSGAEFTAMLGLRGAAETATADDALYTAYTARKAAAGQTALSRAAWQSKLDTLRINKAVGDAYRDQFASDAGITFGKDGWTSEYTVPGLGRRFDIANTDTRVAYEVKSGSSPTADTLTQLNKDELAIKAGWRITWQLKQPLSPTVMARIQQLAADYPGDFMYTIAGG